MQITKLFQLSLLTVVAVTVVLIVTNISVSIQTAQADPPLDEPPQYEEIYEVLEDGNIVVTRTQVLPSQVQATQVCTLPAPALLEPANGAQLNTLVPDYLWKQVSAEVFRYLFQLLSFFTDMTQVVFIQIDHPRGASACHFTSCTPPATMAVSKQPGSRAA